MKFTRRDFLKVTSAGLVLPHSGWASSVEPQYQQGEHPFGILQSATDDSSTLISVMHDRGPNYDFFAWAGEEFIEPISVTTHNFPGSNWVVSTVHFGGLSLGQNYDFHVMLGEKSIDHRIFQTLDLTKSKVRIALISCMNDKLHHSGIWQRLWDSEADLLFFVGDTVYADWNGTAPKMADPEQLWRRYSEARLRLHCYHQRHLIPSLALWDDHDYGANNANRDYPYKDIAKEIFENFFPQDDSIFSSLSKGPGVSQRFRAFGQEFFFLDGRSFRAPGFSQEDDPLFGPLQTQWLFDNMDQVQKPTWLITGGQFFGKYRAKDSFEHLYNEQFHDFMGQLKQYQLPIGFMSGDVHYSEIQKIENHFLDYSALEITSSSMHSLTLPGQHRRFRNPRREQATSNHNFVLVDIDAGAEDLKIEMRSERSRKTAFRSSFHLHR